MPKISREDVRVPLDVMPEFKDTYRDNYMAATRGTGRLMLFACDQKFEHLNKDFYGEGIDIADAEPEHLFKIGSQGVCGVLAGQRGLIARYAADYPEINYLVKMNSKTNLVKTAQEDPYSPQLHDLEAVLAMRAAGVNIVGLGYTIYLGSEYEATMMAEAGELIAQAHANGLIVVLWIYPRGKAVTAEKTFTPNQPSGTVELRFEFDSSSLDGKEIVARENEVAALRSVNPSKAYFNCHTDITIPYDELAELTAVKKDGDRITIIQNGRFVLPGTEELNEPLQELS